MLFGHVRLAAFYGRCRNIFQAKMAQPLENIGSHAYASSFQHAYCPCTHDPCVWIMLLTDLPLHGLSLICDATTAAPWSHIKLFTHSVSSNVVGKASQLLKNF